MDKPVKPLIVARQDFVNELLELINSSNIPAFVILPILNDVTNMVSQAMDKQYNQANEAYQKEMNEYYESLKNTKDDETEESKEV